MTEPDTVVATPVVDAHHHLWDLAVRDQDWTRPTPVLHRTYDLAELEPQLQAAGVDRTVLVQTVHVPEETPEFLGHAADSTVVAGVVGWTDLTAPTVADELARFRTLPGGDRLVGIRHLVQAETDPRWLLRTDVLAGLRAVGSAGLVFDLLVTADQLPAAVDVARALPEVRFVLDHGAKPRIARGELDPWRDRIRSLAALPNVAVKLSGLLTEAAEDWTLEVVRPYADHLLACFGADRTMFGSDWPVSVLRAPYDAVVDVTRRLVAAASPDERAAVMGGTAVRWYGLRADALC